MTQNGGVSRYDLYQLWVSGTSTVALTQTRQQLFTKLDANADGGIDETEFLSGAKAGDRTASSKKDRSGETALQQLRQR